MFLYEIFQLGAFQSMSGIFEGAIDSVSHYMPVMPSIPYLEKLGLANGKKHDKDIRRRQRSTTPHGDLRKPKKPLVQFYEDDYLDSEDKLNRWYNPFMMMAETTMEPSTTTAGSIFSNWLGGSSDDSKESIETTTVKDSSE